MSLSLLILRRFWRRLVLRTMVLQWLRVTLRLPGFSGCGVLAPGLTSLLDVHSLGDVRCGVQISVVCNTTGGAVRIRVVAHVQVGLTDMALL